MFGWNLKRSAWLSKISELDERSLSNPINPLYLPRQCQYRFFHPLYNRLDKAHTLPDQLQHSDNSHQESKCHWISTDLNEKQFNKYYLFLWLWAGGILRILQSDWFRERAVFSYLLTTVMVTNYAKRRVKLRIERAKFQFVLIIFCNEKKQSILTKAITVMSFVDTSMRQCAK